MPVGVIVFINAIFIMIFGIGLFLPMTDRMVDTRTNDKTETSLSCSTGAGETECDVTLESDHFWSPGNAGLVVTETSPSSVVRTSDSSASANVVTVAGLSGSTSYTFTVSYQIANTELVRMDLFGTMMDQGRMVMVGMLIAIMFGGIIMAANSIRSR